MSQQYLTAEKYSRCKPVAETDRNRRLKPVFLTRESFSQSGQKFKTIISGLDMSEIIPISKTPTQEKVPFIPPNLDWNENGKNESI